MNDDGRSSLQMMTVMDMHSNTLILDEIVLNNFTYRFGQYGEDFYLTENGEEIECKLKSEATDVRIYVPNIHFVIKSVFRFSVSLSP